MTAVEQHREPQGGAKRVGEDHKKSQLQRYNERTALSTRVVYAQRILSALLNFAQMVALARILEPAEYGIALIVIIITNYLTVLRDMGFSASAIQIKTLDISERTALFWYNAIVTGTIAIMVAATSPWFASFYAQPPVKSMIIVSAISFFIAGIGTQHAASLKREICFWKVSLAETAGLIIGFAVTLVTAVMQYGAWSLVIGLAVQNLITTAGYFGFAKWLPRKPNLLRAHLHLLRFGANTSVFYILNYSAYNFPTIAIGYWYGTEELAFFSRAQTLFMFPLTFFIIPILQVIYPLLCRVRHDEVLTYEVYGRVLSASALVLFPSAVLMGILATDIILLLFGPNWISAAPILRWFCFALASFGALGPFGQFMTSQGHAVALRNWGVFDFIVRGGAALAGATVSPVCSAAGFGLASLLVIAPASLLVSWRVGRVSIYDQLKAFSVAFTPTISLTTAGVICIIFVNIIELQSPVFRIFIVSGCSLLAWALAVFHSPKTRLLMKKRFIVE